MVHFSYKIVFFLLVLLGSFHFGCKSSVETSPEQTALLKTLDESIAHASNIKTALLLRADSLKVSNEFEALKVKNNLNILDENVATLVLYRDTLTSPIPSGKSFEEVKLMALTQIEYVNSLVASGQAMLDNRSFSFGKWKQGDPNNTKDSIETPVQK